MEPPTGSKRVGLLCCKTLNAKASKAISVNSPQKQYMPGKIMPGLMAVSIVSFRVERACCGI
jgi:hypothetical protein